MISKLVIRLETTIFLKNGAQEAYQCPGFLINNNNDNYVTAENQISFDSIFSAYHCFEDITQQNESRIIEIKIKTPSDVVLQSLRMSIKDLAEKSE